MTRSPGSHQTRRLVSALLAVAAALSCARTAPPGAPEPATPGVTSAVADTGLLAIPPLPLPRRLPPPDDAAGEPGLTIRLREARTDTTPETPEPAATPTPTDIEPLPAERAERMLARLPPLPRPDTARFRFPAAAPPPPRTGRVVLAPFPPPDSMRPPVPIAEAPGELEVVRVVPTGNTELAPHLTITFSDAMVPLTTVQGTEARTQPVRLTPQPPGRWLWVDTRTVRFQPDPRFPMATTFTVEVPAGTRSIAGAVLDTAVRTAFRTPAPRAIGAYPALSPDAAVERNGRAPPAPYRIPDDAAWSVTLQPVVLIAFDQRVSPGAVLGATRLIAAGRTHPVRFATAAEIAADTTVSELVEELEEGRWVALRPVAPLPGESDVQLVLGSDLASAEGPLTTEQPQALRFRTFGPLRIASHRCSEDVCRPREPWYIQLTNALAHDTLSRELVRVEPALDDMAVRVFGAMVQITGDSRPNTSYTITLSPSVQDRFGQRLEEPRSVTFRVGDPYPMISIVGEPFIVLDPDGPPRVTLRSQVHRSLRVRVYRVMPDRWIAWGAAFERAGRGETIEPPGELVTSMEVDVGANAAEFHESVIDVGPALRNGLGHAIVVVEPTEPAAEPARGRRSAAAWVQSTRIGLAASYDADDLLVWASSLNTGEPVGGAEITMLPTDRKTVTAANGTARIPLAVPGDVALIATSGADAALLPSDVRATTYRRAPWERRSRTELLWYSVTDRGLYRPGDTVHLKGWLRERSARSSADVQHAEGVSAIAFTMRGPRGEELSADTLRPGDLGGFSTTVALPDALNLGHAMIELRASGPDVPSAGRESHHSVQVQEFRRPDYEVRVEADPGPHIVGAVIDVLLNAAYYGGGGLADAPLDWRVTTRPGHYRPPGWDGWHFGRAPWWSWRGSDSGGTHELSGVTDAAGRHRLLIDLLAVEPPFATSLRAEAQVQDLTRQIGSDGVDLLVHPAALNVGLRMARGWLHPGDSAEVSAVVVDHDGRPSAGRAVELVLERVANDWWRRGAARATGAGRVVCRLVSDADPARCSFAVDSSGMHMIRADVRDDAGRISRSELMFRVSGAASLPDPRREPGSFELVADRDEYQPGDTARLLVQAPFHPAEALVTIRSVGLVSTERLRIDSPSHEIALPITADFIPGVQVRVELVDAERGTGFAHGETRITVPPHRRELDVNITPSDSVSAPGDEVTIDVEVRDAEGRAAAGAEVALWMVDEAVLALGGYTVPDPLDAFYVQRFAVFDQHSRRWVVHQPRSAGPRTLSGVVIEAEVGRPLAGATVRIEGTEIDTTTSYDGSFTLRGLAPGEHVLVITAPDGITGRRTVTVPPDGVHVGNLVLGASGLAAADEAARAGAEMLMAGRAVAVAPPPAPPPPPAPERVQLEAMVVTGADAAAQDVDLRTDFAPLAFFEPSLRTDTNGRVQVTARLPESLTRYRVMAVAVSGAQRFGTAEATVTARKELMVRIAAPRFLNFGDEFELPVLLQNVTSRAMTIDLAARAGGIDLHGAAGRTLTLGPGARVEVRFDATAPSAGTAHVQVIAATAQGESDATSAIVPVYTPATLEAFATYGTIDTDAPIVLPLERPEDVIEDFGGLEVSITSTALHSLTDAVLFLYTYPFTGSEHIASRVLAVAALRDVLTAFGASGLPDPAALVAQTQSDIAELVRRQNPDGGWPFWSGYPRSNPFVSIHVAHALQRAREKGFDVTPTALERATVHLRAMASHTAQWPHRARQSAAAYAVYVRHRIGDGGAVSEARRLATAALDRVGGELPIEAVGWLLHVLAADPASRIQVEALQRTLLNRLVETAGAVTFAERYEDGEHLLLHSRRRTDAVVLEALIAADGADDVIVRLAQSLLAHRTAGRWSGTQENSWVLLALDEYFRTYEATTPDFASRVWLDERFAGTHAFEGRTTERQQIDVPMQQLLRSDADELIIARNGAGRMYYRAGLRYAPADLSTPSVDRGFEVSRTYEAVDDPEDVRLDGEGTVHVRAGARVRVRLTIVAPSIRYHAALVDPLPAGFEPLNPELRGTGFTDDPEADERPGWFGWQPTWFDHQNLRDDRAEAFAALLRAGVYEYSYLARATTPGTFVVPPPRAEMMYQPETFGRGEGDVVVVEER